tara:strand:+ start:67920 stop:68339 length:420 start_codon:yes stop_codon:yes gene_type:complete
MTSPYQVEWREDSTSTVIARITSRIGSGAATGVNGEGNFLQIADVSTIVVNVFDLDAADPDTAADTASVTVATAVLDTVVTSNVIWTKDTVGYNFIHDLSAAYFPTGNRRYEVEYVFTLTDGSVFHIVYDGIAIPVRSS